MTRRRHNLYVDTEICEAQHSIDSYLEEFKEHTPSFNKLIYITRKKGILTIVVKENQNILLEVDYDNFKNNLEFFFFQVHSLI